MKGLLYTAILFLLFWGCQNQDTGKSYVNKTDWSERQAGEVVLDSLYQGRTYLPVYSQIYHIKDGRKYDLTVTVSIRNTSLVENLYLRAADYYNTGGSKIRSYVERPIYLEPMETLEIIIADADIEGGTGGNFIFDWSINSDKSMPLYEAVMITSEGQQGISFTTRGVEIEIE